MQPAGGVELDPAQNAAVTTPSTLVAVIAGAGSGKTRVLTSRIAHRIAIGTADPQHTLALTFTREAAGELRRRLRRTGVRDHVEAGTFHSVALGLLRQRWADTEPAGRRPSSPIHDRLLAEVAGGIPLATLATERDWAAARGIAADRYVDAAREAGRRSRLVRSCRRGARRLRGRSSAGAAWSTSTTCWRSSLGELAGDGAWCRRGALALPPPSSSTRPRTSTRCSTASSSNSSAGAATSTSSVIRRRRSTASTAPTRACSSTSPIACRASRSSAARRTTARRRRSSPPARRVLRAGGLAACGVLGARRRPGRAHRRRRRRAARGVARGRVPAVARSRRRAHRRCRRARPHEPAAHPARRRARRPPACPCAAERLRPGSPLGTAITTATRLPSATRLRGVGARRARRRDDPDEPERRAPRRRDRARLPPRAARSATAPALRSWLATVRPLRRGRRWRRAAHVPRRQGPGVADRRRHRRRDRLGPPPQRDHRRSEGRGGAPAPRRRHAGLGPPA